MHSAAGGTGNSKVVATLRADGSVAMEAQSFNQQLNLLNYEIVSMNKRNRNMQVVTCKQLQRTENELLLKKGNVPGPTTVVDLGKQLLQCARDSDVPGVKTALAHGAPFSSDWVCYQFQKEHNNRKEKQV